MDEHPGSRTPVTYDHYAHIEGPFYHGTRSGLEAGTELVPGHGSSVHGLLRGRSRGESLFAAATPTGHPAALRPSCTPPTVGPVENSKIIEAASGPVARYVFLDGPLAGQVLDSRDAHARGERIEVSIADVCQAADDVPSFRYAVHAPARLDRPGRLRHVGPQPTPHPSDLSAA